MKILHINAGDDPSGAYISAWQWHECCLKNGLESKVLVLNQKLGNKPNQFHFWDFIQSNFFEKCTLFIRRKLHNYSKLEEDLRAQGIQFSSHTTPYRIEKHPLVKEADIIHLHQGAKMINWASFFKDVDKKIIYTMHDSEPFTAGFHVMKNVKKDLEIQLEKLLIHKRNLVHKKHNIIPVFPSQNHYSKSLNGVFKAHHSEILPHLLNSSNFYPMDKDLAKANLGLDRSKKYCCFIVSELNRKGKGYEQLLYFKDQIQALDIIPICVGKSMGVNKVSDWIYTEALHAEDLRNVYNASEFTVQLSEEESFGLTVLESLLCGTPVLSTAVGIAPELTDLGVKIIDVLSDLHLQISPLPTVTLNIEDWNKKREEQYLKLLGVQ